MNKIMVTAFICAVVSMMTGCDNYHATGNFYVASTSKGYKVCIDDPVADTMVVTKSMAIQKAQTIADKLNADIPAEDRPE